MEEVGRIREGAGIVGRGGGGNGGFGLGLGFFKSMWSLKLGYLTKF